MSALFGFLVGVIGGFAAHTITMKVSFKQRTIDNKIKVFDALIGTWVKMRNYIFAHHPGTPIQVVPPNIAHEYDQIYGQSQQLIGEAFLVCEDEALTNDINEINERLYRTPWYSMPHSQVNTEIEKFKTDALRIVARMREDIRGSTRLERKDFLHIVSGLWGGRN